jgi:SagB-type dehydrogenase family enzyme
MHSTSILIAALAAAACGKSAQSQHGQATTAKGATANDTMRLPTPRVKGGVSLEETLAQRRSMRDFSAQPISASDLGQLLWAAQGVTNAAGYRTAPSAGALYPLELYAATEAGLAHYEPNAHRLTRSTERDVRPAVAQAALSQGAVRSAPALIIIAAVYRRTAAKYGQRATRYVQLEAGHAAQNILLQAVALGLGAVPIGAFDDAALARALALADDVAPLYIIAVGSVSR